LWLIGHSILFFNDEMFHPSFYTLSPIIGVCLIIWFSNKNEFITKILSTKLFVGIGLISYSLYLWHYPIFAFAREIELFDGSLIKKLIIGITILILSIFSYFFIEKQFRNRENNFRKILLCILLFVIILFIFNISVTSLKGYENRFNYKFSKNFTLVEKKSRTLIKNLTGEEIYDRNIIFKSKSTDLNIFLVGDSHAETLTYEIWKNFKDNYNINFSVYSDCQFILNLNRVDKKDLKPNSCTKSLQEKRIEFINRTKNSIVILFGRLPKILNEESFNNFEYGFYEDEMSDFLQDEKLL
jgi:hypothetical protein